MCKTCIKRDIPWYSNLDILHVPACPDLQQLICSCTISAKFDISINSSSVMWLLTLGVSWNFHTITHNSLIGRTNASIFTKAKGDCACRCSSTHAFCFPQNVNSFAWPDVLTWKPYLQRCCPLKALKSKSSMNKQARIYKLHTEGLSKLLSTKLSNLQAMFWRCFGILEQATPQRDCSRGSNNRLVAMTKTVSHRNLKC